MLQRECQVSAKWMRRTVFCAVMLASSDAVLAQDCIILIVKYVESVTNEEGGLNHLFKIPRSEQLKMPNNIRMPDLYCALTGFRGAVVQGNWYNLCVSLDSVDEDYVYARCDGSGS